MTLKLAVVGRRQGIVLSVVILLFNLISGVLCSPAPDCHNNSLPGLVDLGYSKHIPGWRNTTGSGKRVSVYRNIRFAKPPTGDLRFRKPDINTAHEDGIQDGLYPWLSTDCIASAPIYAPFPGVAGTAWGHEDCLFLDVWVPEGVKPGDNVPVIHWYFGSAYAFGSKDVSFNPIGLFDHADEDQKFIFVTNNYRYAHQPARRRAGIADIVLSVDLGCPAGPTCLAKTWMPMLGYMTASQQPNGPQNT
jgi:hypothetical protein